MRRRNIILVIIALIIALPLAAILIFVASFNPNAYKPQIIAAIERATHRQVTIAGDLQLAASLAPVISASGITLANPPGYPDATMMTLSRIEAQVALLPLLGHHVDLVNLTLDQPVITLERNAQGVGNWMFQQPAPPAQSAPSSAQPAGHAAIALQSVSVRNGTLILKQASTVRTLTIGKLTAQAQTLDAPLHLKLQAAYQGQPFTVAGTTGPISRFNQSGASDTRPWPIDATIAAAGATARFKGVIAHPRSLAGYDVTVSGAAPDLAALDPYVSGYALPPLKSVSFAGRLTGSGAEIPAVSDAQFAAGASDLSAIRPGLQLASLQVTMASLDASAHVDAAGSLAGKALALKGTLGPLSALLPQPAPALPSSGSALAQSAPSPQPAFAIDMAGSAGASQFTTDGTLAAPLRLAGVALKITAQIPDLSHLSALAGMALPALTHGSATMAIIDPGGLGLRHGVGFQSLAVSSDQAQFGGAGSVSFGAVPDLQAIINAPRIDLAAVLAAMPPPTAPGPVTGNPVQPAAPVQTPPASPNQLISNAPLPLGILRQAAGNVELSVGQLLYQGVTYQAIQAHALLQNAVLTIRPFSAQLPGGGIDGAVTVNAAATPPQVSFNGEAPAFGVAPLLASLNLPHTAAGTVQAYANLAGQGNTPHEIASTLNGALGVSMVNGVVDGAVIDHFFGAALRAENLPVNAIGAQGPALIRCFAARMDAANGIGALRAFTLESSRLYLTGAGTLNFGPETLNLVLQPQVQVSGGAIPLPVRLAGSFAHPSAGIAPPGDYGATASAIGQHFAGDRGFLGTLARRLGIAKPAASPQSCAGALALARLGHSGPAPAPAPAAMPGYNAAPQGSNQPPQSSGPQNLLQNLFK